MTKKVRRKSSRPAPKPGPEAAADLLDLTRDMVMQEYMDSAKDRSDNDSKLVKPAKSRD